MFNVKLVFFAGIVGYASVVGGSRISPNLVQVQVNSIPNRNCAGTMLNEYIVLTAATCVQGIVDYTDIRVQLDQGRSIAVDAVVSNPLFRVTSRSDNALLRLALRAQIGDLIALELSSAEALSGTTAITYGWDRLIAINAPLLPELNLSIYRAECNILPGFLTRCCRRGLLNIGACAGDLGSPLIDGRGRLIGVLGSGCPTKFASIAASRSFIEETMLKWK